MQDEGRRWSGSHLILLVAPGGKGASRLGITVSRRLGGAVTRNLIKRRLREAYRLHRERFREGFDLVVVARGSAVKVTYRKLEQDLLRLAGSAGILSGAGARSEGRDGEAR